MIWAWVLRFGIGILRGLAFLFRHVIKSFYVVATSFISTLIFKMLALFGLTSFTLTGIDYAIKLFYDSLNVDVESLPFAVLSFVSIMKFDIALSLIISAITVRLLLDGVSSTTSSLRKYILSGK